MTALKRLVLFVEGQGDRAGAPILVKRLLTNASAWDCVILDKNPMMVGELGSLLKDEGKEWKRYLRAAISGHKPLGAVLLLLDGDAKKVQKETFCAKIHAARLGALAKDAGAGSRFSVAIAFARQEFESWVIACADKIAGKQLPDGREGLPAGTLPPESDLEEAPRDAKGWLAKRLAGGYKEAVDQAPFTQLLVNHLDTPRLAQMRSFRRLTHAMQVMVDAIRSGSHVVSPSQSDN